MAVIGGDPQGPAVGLRRRPRKTSSVKRFVLIPAE